MVKIISDNCCDLPDHMVKELDIILLHMMVRFGVSEYLPEVFNINDFYTSMKDSLELPTTSQPTIQEIRDVYQAALADGSEVIAIHLSSGMTGTIGSAEMVRQDLIGKERLHIVDSKKASTGEGLMVLEAARMAKTGKTVTDILNRLSEMQKTVRCIFTIDTLDYLVKGGRVSKTAGFLGNILDIKAILHVNQDGFIVPYDKVRGHKSALKRIIRAIAEEGIDLRGQTVGVSHGASPDDAFYIRDVFLNELGAKEVVMGEIGPVVGSHVGPGTLSVFFEGTGVK